MRSSAICTLALAVSSLAFGCATTEQDEALGEPEVLETQEQALTLAECATQRDQCFAKNPLFGFFTCPGQYNQCAVTASNGIPAQISSAIADAAECRSEGLACRSEATTLTARAICAENEAECVAAIVGVDLPDVVEGTAACVEASVSCINKARRVTDLAVCGEAFTSCAVEQVQTLIPPAVGEIIKKANACRTTLDRCVAQATTASAIAACGEQSATCVAGTLGVTLPNVPLSEVVECAETAAGCALDVSSAADVAECAAELRTCAASAVVGPKPLTCDQKWTACMAANPFNFFKCSDELFSCQNN